MSYEQEVLLVRHPEIDRGGKALCYGHLDLGLTPRGIEMVKDLAGAGLATRRPAFE
jgi:broad specificity phosphatase PhoE